MIHLTKRGNPPRHGARRMLQHTTADQWPADIGEQMAFVYRIYPIVDRASDAQLVDLLKLVEDLRAVQ